MESNVVLAVVSGGGGFTDSLGSIILCKSAPSALLLIAFVLSLAARFGLNATSTSASIWSKSKSSSSSSSFSLLR